MSTPPPDTAADDANDAAFLASLHPQTGRR